MVSSLEIKPKFKTRESLEQHCSAIELYSYRQIAEKKVGGDKIA